MLLDGTVGYTLLKNNTNEKDPLHILILSDILS